MTFEEQIQAADKKIAELERALVVAQEHRRELVNRGNLNKCQHARRIPMAGFYISSGNKLNVDGYYFCQDCGAKL